MKKSGFLFALLVTAVLAASSLFMASCSKNKKAGTSGTASSAFSGKNSTSRTIKVTAEAGKATFDSMISFFKPDYTAETPDSPEEIEESKVSSKKSKKDKETTSVIPKIRKLDEYKTEYSSARKTFITYTPGKKEEEEDLSGTLFKVEDWGPKTSVVSEANFPSFYVIFSQPVRSLSALDAPSSTSEFVSITPSLKGKFHWYGTQHISFEAEEAADPSVVYTISVNPQVKSIYGHSISGETVFKTEAEPVKIKNIWGGYFKENMCHYDNTTGALPDCENRVFVRTNYLLKAESLADKLVISIGKRTLSNSEFTVEADFSNKSFSYWKNEPECDKEKKTSNSFIVTLNTTIPHNSEIVLITKDDPKKFSYKTLQPFDRVSIAEYTQYTDGNLGNPLKVIFTQVPDENAVLNYITVTDSTGTVEYSLTKDNIVLNGRYLTIHSLPLEFNTDYRLYIYSGFYDIYGQIYNNGEYTYYYNFKTRPVKAYVNYLDYGSRMLEAQYPHKIIYEHQNVYNTSFYKIRATDNPLNIDTSYILLGGDPQHLINDNVRNQRHFEEIELDPYLTNGYGFVRFYANTEYNDFDRWTNEEYVNEDKNILTIQVTDLGITTRMGINRAVVMVRSLSANEPVSDAEVYILDECSNITDDPLNHIIAQGKTDKNGLAIINYTEEQILAYEQNENYRYS